MKILQTFKRYMLGLAMGVLILFGLVVFAVPSANVYADAKGEACNAIGTCSSGGDRISKIIKTVIDLLSSIAGIIAVIMIIIGGVKYMTSSGDSNQASSARNTILYAVVGLIVVAFSQVIVRFVLQQV